MKFFISSEHEELQFKNELAVQLKVSLAVLVDEVYIGGFDKNAQEDRDKLEELINLLNSMLQFNGECGCLNGRSYDGIKNFDKWFVGNGENKCSFDWPEVLEKDKELEDILDTCEMASLVDYEVFYFDEYGRKHKVVVQ